MQRQTISRRRFLSTSLATAGALQLAAHGFALSADSCLLTPEQEVGPFYVGSEMLRSKIAEGKPGVPLRLRLVIMDRTTCAPLSNAAIDLWHCDAMGLYSGFTASRGFGPPGGEGGPPPNSDPGFSPGQGPRPGFGLPPVGPGGPHPQPPTDKLTFLRGIQMTGPDGAVTYETIFPGFYQGRVNHIHFKVRLDGHRSGRTYEAGHVSHTGQVFFPEEAAVHLMTQAPYAAHAIHRTTMAEDHVFNDQHGPLATLRPLDSANLQAGFIAEYRAFVDPAVIPAPVDMRPGPPPRG